ncbi:hypothetical protein [Neisseria sicca]|uniref:hypothetical protein n=1 Tax=Neisseria sicca TaxID=490 RepID=UPI0039656033
MTVSTHSRPKAAGCPNGSPHQGAYRFNTQPPEGGWLIAGRRVFRQLTFQHTAARRRLAENRGAPAIRLKVSTHSRPKAAGS